MTYLLIFFTSLILTIFFTPYLISFLKRTRIVDYPGGRKIHSEAMPKMGGVIIFFVVLIMLNAFVEVFITIKFLIIPLSILVFSGIIDDVLGLNNFVKFLVQNISAIFLILFLEQYYSDIKLLGMYLEAPYDYLVLILFIVGTINSINFLDGLDGLASGFSILVFSVLLVLAISKEDVFLILLNVSLLGSTLGFLRFNAFPAKIFLGNTGSVVLGFFLIVTSILTSINYNVTALDLTFPIILLGVPIIDTLKVFVVRIVKKRDPFSGDTSHQHHIIKKSLINHEATVFLIQLFALAFIFIALIYLFDYKLGAIIAFLILSVLLLSLHPLLSKVSLAKKINAISLRVKSIPVKNVSLLIKFMLIIAFVLMCAVIVVSFSYKTSLTINELSSLIIMVFSLYMLALLQLKENSVIGEINIFLNFTIFFIISKLSLPSVFNEDLTIRTIQIIHDWNFYLLTIVISLTLLLRWNSLMTKKMFFTGFDLIIIVFIMLTFFVNNILQFDLNYFLSLSLLEGFIFYTWFKLIANFYPQYEQRLVSISFMLPMIILLVLIIADIFKN